MSSRITWSVFAAMVLVATCFVALKVLPTCKGVYTQMQMPLPGFTRLVFAAGPAVLIVMGAISASFMVIGEFKPVVRRIREPFGFLVMMLAILALVAMYMPRFKCGEVINPRASAPVHSTAPQAALKELSAQDFTKSTR